ncbi:hypothetical protein KAH94_06665, partial [bacterium]|nr:hypothetical protein [bacterium]
EVTGISIKDIFESEKRRDVWITAKEAKKIGLVHKVTRLEPSEIKAFEQNLVAFSKFDGEEIIEKPQGSGEKEKETIIDIKNEKKKIMTRDELKASHPELFEEIYQSGVKAESDRIGAYLAFSEIDMEAVKKGISSKEVITQTFMAEMTLKAISNKTLDTKEKESPKESDPPKGEKKEKTAEEVEYANAEKEIFEAAGLKNEEVQI